jgi:phospholipid transport system substrate-binding protein
MPKSFVKYVLVVASAFSAPLSLADSAAPDTLLRSVADELIGKTNLDGNLHAPNPERVAMSAEYKIVPLFDFPRMTQFAVARNWNLATAEQRATITEEFSTLLVRTYVTALARYRDQPVEFKQLRAAQPPGTNVTIRAEVKQPGMEKMTLDHEMEKTAAGWKIYNVKIADVCLLSNYRDVFAEKVRDGGVDGLIKFLVAENNGGGSKFKSIEASVWEQSRMLLAILQNAIRSGLR